MNNLQPTHTKARIYLKNADGERHRTIDPFIAKIRDRVSAVAEFKTADETVVLEVIALREVIHHRGLPTYSRAKDVEATTTSGRFRIHD